MTRSFYLQQLPAGIALTSFPVKVTMIQPQYISCRHITKEELCWQPSFSTAKPGEWVHFGTIASRSQFTWPAFKTSLLKERCKDVTLRFTFTLDGEAAPTGAGAGDRTAKLETDERLPQIVIMLDDKPRIQGILPQRPWK